MTLNKTLKKISKFIAAAMIVCTYSTIAFAGTPTQAVELNALSEKYDLKDIKASELPKGVKPIEFKTVAEADAFLKEIKESNPVVTVSKQDTKNSLTNSDVSIKSYPIGSQSKMVMQWIFGWVTATATYHYKYDSDQSCNVFDDCTSVSSSMSGLNPGITYEQVPDSKWSNITNSGKTLEVGFTGHLSYYLLVDGVLKIGDSTNPITCSFTNP